MKRKDKIRLLEGVRTGKIQISTFLKKGDISPPSWYWMQFESREGLLMDLRSTWSQRISVIWENDRPLITNYTPKKRFNWFTNE